MELVLYNSDGDTLATWKPLEDLKWDTAQLGEEVKQTIKDNTEEEI